MLRHTAAQYIVKSDVDGFLCPHHLQYVLQALPERKLFYSLFHDTTSWAMCRADQNFQAFSRDLLQDSLRFFNSTAAWQATVNWASNFGGFLRRAWVRNEATVFDDRFAIVSQHGDNGGGNAMKAIQHYETRTERSGQGDVYDTFCNKFVFGHILSKDVRPFRELYRRSVKGLCAGRALNDTGTCYNLSAYLTGKRDPPCFKPELEASVNLTV